MRAIVFGCCALLLLSGAVRAQTSADEADRAAVAAIIDNFEQSYQRRDGARWAQHFAPDADFMQAFGRYLRGRPNIESFMTFFLESQSDALQARETSRRIAFPSSTVSFAELTEEVDGVVDFDGTAQPSRLDHLMLVLKEDQGVWSIVHYRYLDIHTGPLRS